jgi:hypothetical protein
MQVSPPTGVRGELVLALMNLLRCPRTARGLVGSISHSVVASNASVRDKTTAYSHPRQEAACCVVQHVLGSVNAPQVALRHRVIVETVRAHRTADIISKRRDVVELLTERGIKLDHVTIYR